MFLGFVNGLMFLIRTTFRKLDLFPSSGEVMVAPTLLRPLERAESLDFFGGGGETLAMDKVQKHNSFKCNVSSS
jgi:hypothetical protein